MKTNIINKNNNYVIYIRNDINNKNDKNIIFINSVNIVNVDNYVNSINNFNKLSKMIVNVDLKIGSHAWVAASPYCVILPSYNSPLLSSKLRREHQSIRSSIPSFSKYRRFLRTLTWYSGFEIYLLQKYNEYDLKRYKNRLKVIS